MVAKLSNSGFLEVGIVGISLSAKLGINAGEPIKIEWLLLQTGLVYLEGGTKRSPLGLLNPLMACFAGKSVRLFFSMPMN